MSLNDLLGNFLQSAAEIMMSLAVISLCIVAHFMLNFQKRLAFQKIEKSVNTQLAVERENAKQVCIRMECIC